MKNDVIQYDRIYHLLKSRIESGILPVGARLPGRAVLCREFGTSERTVRRAVELLEQDGYLQIFPKKRPVVVSAFAAPESRTQQRVNKASAAQVNDLMQTSILLCSPIYLRGLRLCGGADWHIPEALLARMDAARPEEFWQLASRLGRFFIAKNENELLLRVVDCLGFRGKKPPSSSLEDRIRYRLDMEKLLQTVKSGAEPRRAELEPIVSPYRAIAEQSGDFQLLQPASPCPMLAEANGLRQRLILTQERYSTVCLDLLGLIAIGRYQPGDQLPTHDQLQGIYGVSRDTTVKAIRMLRQWGVVTTAPRRGISVVMDLTALKKIQITPASIACHVRRYLDSLELLSLTVERVAAHAAAHTSPDDAALLRKSLLNQLEQPCVHQLIPRTLLDFITAHIQYDALRSIYEILARNFSIGRSIPKLVSPDKNPQNKEIYRQCIEAAEILIGGDAGRFAQAAAGLFKLVRGLIIAACKRMGYWDAAMQVYDGASLWR